MGVGRMMARRSTTLESLPTGSGRSVPLQIAVLDSDSGFLMVLAKRLERLEWIHSVLDPSIPTEAIASLNVDALIVDFARQGPGRWAWLERLCQSPRGFSIVICTGPSTVVERVRALRLGADGWLSKPCHPEELIARVEAVVGRRHRPEPRSLEPITAGEVEVRRDLYQAFVHERSLGLTRREYQLIELLSSADGEVVPRSSIYERLWGFEMARNDRSVDVFVHKLRRKLESASPRWCYVHTHFGIGYRFAAEPVDGVEAPRELEPAVAVAVSSDARLAA
jgi:DNA-binding response OmpR family regulator